MNLREFLNQIDAGTMDLPKEKLVEFIRELARTLPENQRDEFLERLCELGEGALAKGKRLKSDTEKLQAEVDDIRAKLLKIENGDLYLSGSLNERYDRWDYDSEEEQLILEDPHNIFGIIEKACALIHRCVDRELYQTAYELAAELIVLEIEVDGDGDYYEYENIAFSLEEIEGKAGCSFDHKQLIADALYAAYQANPLEKRADVLYQLICDLPWDGLTLELLLPEDTEGLDQWADFIDLWIEYLGKTKGDEAARLLAEAMAIKDEPGQALEMARKFYQQHPGVYEQVLRQNRLNYEITEQLVVGQEALAKIQPQYVVRSRIALMTAVYALELHKRDEAERCWLEAFRSDTRPIHYLRLALESSDFSKYREEARDIYRNFAERSKRVALYHEPTGESSENRIDENTFYTLAFLGGEFQYVIKHGMNQPKPLGWSDTFMKTGIALFLLGLYKGNKLLTGCQNMCQNIVYSMHFRAEDYAKGLLRKLGEDNISLFWESFCLWKQMTPMSAEEEQEVMRRLEKWINARVEAIMQNNRRNYYRECAAYIATLGEVKESWGETDGKTKLMETYRAAYSRRSSFHSELRALGMKDTRKKKV